MADRVSPVEAAARVLQSVDAAEGLADEWPDIWDAEKEIYRVRARAVLRAAIEALPEQDAWGAHTIIAPVFVRSNVTTDGTVLLYKAALRRAFGLEGDVE